MEPYSQNFGYRTTPETLTNLGQGATEKGGDLGKSLLWVFLSSAPLSVTLALRLRVYK